jgi:hypothetical protein
VPTTKTAFHENTMTRRELLGGIFAALLAPLAARFGKDAKAVPDVRMLTPAPLEPGWHTTGSGKYSRLQKSDLGSEANDASVAGWQDGADIPEPVLEWMAGCEDVPSDVVMRTYCNGVVDIFKNGKLVERRIRIGEGHPFSVTMYAPIFLDGLPQVS